MITLSKRLGILARMVEKRPSLGKTAIMKSIFILQQVYKVPLGYDFEIYTYGPYSSDVTEIIQLAADLDAITIDTVLFPPGHLGYELKPTAKTSRLVEAEQDFVMIHDDSITEVIQLFGDKTAKELELSSTIIYVFSNHFRNNWDTSVEAVCKSVHRIKPHFDITHIRKEYEALKSKGILHKAVQM